MITLSRRHLIGMGAGALAASAVVGALPASAGVKGYVQSTIARMSLPEKVGQLMVQEVYGVDPTVDDSRNLGKYGTAKGVDVVRDLHLGGVIYFAWTNTYDNGPDGVAAASNALQEASLETRPKGRPGRPVGTKVAVPLLIATDQEQGIVTRFGPPATQFPGSMALGAGRSTNDARTAAAITGKELRAVGINVDFAPDADVNVTPDNPVIGVRSFSSRPDLVADMVAAQVVGYQVDGKVCASAKHFPGHGDTATDSHYGLPEITHTLEEWKALDAPPFEAAIRAGVDMIMTAHLLVPALDPSGDPASVSRPILTGVLRDQLGFDGVIVTDALDMAGVRQKYGDAEVAVRAMEAGVDLLLMSPAPLAARDAVLEAVRTGRLTEAQLDEKVARVLTMKYRRGIVERPLCDPARVDRIVGIPQHLKAADEVTDRTVTLVSNDGTLPVDVTDRRVLVCGWGATTTTAVADALARLGATTTRQTSNAPTAAQITAAVTAARSSDLVVVLTNNVATSASQVNLVKALTGSGTPVVTVAVRNPYDVAYYEANAELCTYSYSPVIAGAVARVITGRVNPQGRLPVDVPKPGGGVYLSFGDGLSY